MSLLSEPAFAAAQIVPFVERKEAWDVLENAIKTPEDGSRVLYVTGSGGIGKTRFLQEALKRLKGEPGLTVASRIIDLYHTQYHTIEGLLDALQSALGFTYFTRYREERRKLERYKAAFAGELAEVELQRKRMVEAFEEDWERLALSRRIVIALDTLERLYYGTTVIREMLEGDLPLPAIRSWLFEFLAWAPNTVVIIAGRPREEQRRELEEKLGERFVPIELGAFSEQESLEYIENLRRVLQERGKELAAERVANLSEETRKVIHKLTGGRPILLALVVDYLASSDFFPEEFTRPYSEIAALSDEELESLRREVEKGLVENVQNLRGPLSDTVRWMAYARKGMTPALLATLAGISPEEAEKRLAEVRELSFVKPRPDDERLFLHDEMYDLLDRYLLSKVPRKRQNEIYRKLAEYSRVQAEDACERLKGLYGEPESGEEWDLDKALECRQRFLESHSAEVHYLLRADPAEGFKLYLRYSDEALLSWDTELDMLLREEMLDFASYAFAGDRTEFRGLRKVEVDAYEAARWVRRLTVLGLTKRAVELYENLESEWDVLFDPYVTLPYAEMKTNGAMALTFQFGDMERAERGLEKAIELLEAEHKKAKAEKREGDLWLIRTQLGSAWNALGYLYRVQGIYKAAIESYGKAIPYWRANKLHLRLAETMNNQAFAMAEAGEPSTAFSVGRDALQLRRQEGPLYPIGLSINTMALIEIRRGNYKDAIDLAEDALAMFGMVGSKRGQGLAKIALAEALTRASGKAPEIIPAAELSLEEKAQLLSEAAEHSLDAVGIFEGFEEKERRIEAYIRLGCAWRDWARLRKRHPSRLESAEELYRRAKEAFEYAAGLSKERLYRWVETKANEAWLEYYMDNVDRALELADEIEARIPEEYKIAPGELNPKISPERACLPLWAYLGKINVLRGVVFSEKFAKTKQDEHLRSSIERFAFGLAYNELVSRDAQGFQLAVSTVYEYLKTFNPEELIKAFETLRDLENRYPALKLGREHCRLWDKLEKWFGEYESYRELV